MLFLHETHKVKGKCEDEFEATMRDGWMKRLAEGDEARLLWYAHHAHGSGASYQVVTVTGIADGAWEGMARRIQSGDLQQFMRDLDELRHDVEGKLLFPVYWSPIQSVDFADVPTDGREHELSLFMEDSGWPDVPLDEYIRFWDEGYYQVLNRYDVGSALLDIQACFQIAHGTHQRREAVLWQKIMKHDVLIHLLANEVAEEQRGPGSYMVEALAYRDQWRSRLLRTSAWSPLY
ncbi:hypothetical protein MK489_24620 [Myxococcota bacterium]|nr:hypothetical protein [Myxococcota bacterium]